MDLPQSLCSLDLSGNPIVANDEKNFQFACPRLRSVTFRQTMINPYALLGQVVSQQFKLFDQRAKPLLPVQITMYGDEQYLVKV